MPANLNLQSMVVIIVSILISLVIHEFMHAYAGYKLGDSTAKTEGRLSLNPLNHIDPMMTIVLPIVTIWLFHTPILAAKPVPFDPRNVKYDEFGAAIIAAAGPLSNLALAVAASLVANAVGLSHPGIISVLNIFIGLNVILFVFNLLPIPPLDGSRVLYAFAPEPVQRFMQQIEPIGLFIIFGLVLTGGLGGILVNLNQFVLNLLP